MDLPASALLPADTPPHDDASVESCDVFVIGAGPAGSTIAALIAQKGWKVVVAEKDRHPRFHIGESLLPLNMPLFEHLGVADRIRDIAIMKYGAELNSPHHAQPVTLGFDQAWDKSFPSAYQVRRSDFDRILFENCVARGAVGIEECRVTGAEFPPEGGVDITARLREGPSRRWHSRFLVDASGRDTFLAGKFGVKKRNPRHSSAALFGHFTGAKRLPGREEGNISLFWFEHGWFWFIPLRDGTTSVGAVCWPYYLKTRRSDPTVFFLETIATCPPLAERLDHAQLTGPATATGNYSYQSGRMSGDRYIMVGDAYAFIDPVFSSGVFLAMNSAFLAADVVEHSLRDPANAAAARRRFERTIRRGLKHFSWFIYRMTSPAMRDLFMAPRNYLRMQEALMSLLAGDLFRRTPIYRSLAAFKLLYYLVSMTYPLRNFAAWRRRRRVLADARAADVSA
jgi:flavin-dependent dehydrogenase